MTEGVGRTERNSESTDLKTRSGVLGRIIVQTNPKYYLKRIENTENATHIAPLVGHCCMVKTIL